MSQIFQNDVNILRFEEGRIKIQKIYDPRVSNFDRRSESN